MEKLYVYELDDWAVWAGREEPPENTVLITTKGFTSEQVRRILNDWNMSLPIQIICDLKSKYFERWK